MVADERQRARRSRSDRAGRAANRDHRSAAWLAGFQAAGRDGVQPRCSQGKQDVREGVVDPAAGGAAHDDQRFRDGGADVRQLIMSCGSAAKAGLYILAVLACAGVSSAQSTGSAAIPPVWQGVYTEAQAARGLSEYTAHCSRCHRDDLSAYNEILKGRRFMEKYRESSLQLLFDKTKTTMPRGAPGSLSDSAYVDIVSYLLNVNELPAGARELRLEDLSNIQLVGRDGPQ